MNPEKLSSDFIPLIFQYFPLYLASKGESDTNLYGSKRQIIFNDVTPKFMQHSHARILQDHNYTGTHKSNSLVNKLSHNCKLRNFIDDSVKWIVMMME